MDRRRRTLIALLGGVAAWPLAARAQQANIARIGFLGAATAAGYAKKVESLRTGLRDLGYVEGAHFAIEFRWAEGNYDRLPGLAAELIARNVDVIVTHGTPATSAAKAATATIPIIMAVSGDADKTGLVQSLARPGGNVTGLTYFAAEHAGKRLEFIKEVMPSVGRVAFLTNPGNPLMTIEAAAMEGAAASLHIALQAFEARAPADLGGALAAIAERGFDVVVVGQDGMLTATSGDIGSDALERRLSIVGEAHLAKAGGLLGHGPNLPEMFRRAAYYVDRVLKGSKAADLPVERPTRFELVINLRAAKALGLDVPATLLARADEVIE